MLLAARWQDYTATAKDDAPLTAEERLAVTAPFGQAWTALAPARKPSALPEAMAEQYARGPFWSGTPKLAWDLSGQLIGGTSAGRCPAFPCVAARPRAYPPLTRC